MFKNGFKHNISYIIGLSHLGGIGYDILMDRFEELNEFIDKARKMTVRQAEQNDVDQYLMRKRYNDKSRHLPQTKKATEKYEKSEKGKLVRKRRSSLKNVGKIKDFYRNTPINHQVDHIIPLALGGQHILENLQYLLAVENQRKPKKRIITDMKVQLMRNRFIRRI